MLTKSKSLLLGICLTGLVIPFSLVANSHHKASASHEVSVSQLYADSSSKNLGGPLARELQGKPVVVDIYSSSCSACRTLAPVLSELKERYKGKAHFIVFDVSNRNTSRQAEAKARELGLGDFFAKHKSQTATVTIIDPNNGNILSQDRKNANLNAYTSVLDNAIAQR
ncbi:thioredoxin domain-containing protein [Crocosphaera sp.]|uniref:TlpA family protein disulfide reductase n=1 Tax=Crocosphaera sp. TaxID=2729996 RepID=UPI00263231A9|nr:thioredoxin domain-containing protein [Crocosphaera sp.]MDJ0580234.1 thioredoxin domain-containing protein [Crocosphaera sp.]